MLKFAKTTREKIAGRTSIPPHGSHPFIVCLSVPRAEITNIFGPKDSRQDTMLLACATMLLSNARNYCHTSGQRVKALRLLRQSSLDPIQREGGVVAVAVLAAGRTGPAAPGSERADRLHLPHERCTALPAQCSHAEWCGARFATPPTCAPVSGVNTDDTRLPWSNSAYMCALQ